MFDPTIVILIPAILFALYAQSKVSMAYNKYLRINNRRGITGRQAARMILDYN
ncbi:MAG: zinc metallopeptidase, partial [Anaerovoracaceae bacterium]